MTIPIFRRDFNLNIGGDAPTVDIDAQRPLGVGSFGDCVDTVAIRNPGMVKLVTKCRIHVGIGPSRVARGGAAQCPSVLVEQIVFDE